jgi:Flp pilus assembly protein TadG
MRSQRCQSGASWRRDEGATAVTVAVVMVVLLGLSALVVDVGSLYTERAKVQTAADAAALAGVHDLPDTTLARSRAQGYASSNAPEAPVVKIEFYSGDTVYTADAGSPASTVAAVRADASAPALVPACYTPPIQQSGVPDTVKVTVSNPSAPLYFARIWSMSSTPVSASAKARVQSLAMEGVLPFAVVVKNSAGADFGFTVGQQQNLQEGAGPGNYGWMTLNDPPVKDPGNNDKWQKAEFEDTMDSNGTSYPVYLTLYPGVTGEKTPYMRAFQDWYDRGNRTAILPLISSSGPGSKNVSVLGFARIRFVTRPAKNDVRGVYEHTISESEMTLSPFWPDSTLQKYSLID